MRFAIREARQAAGLTQSELARKAKVAQGKISEYESGNSLPRIDSAKRIALALNMKIDDLLQEVDRCE